MIIDTLEISWHDKKPVLSLDFHRCSDLVRIATAGADNEIRVRLWARLKVLCVLLSNSCIDATRRL